MVIHKFLGNSIISRIHNKNIQTREDLRAALKSNSDIGKGKWLDVSGLLCPIETLDNFLCKVEKKKISTLEEVQQVLEKIHENYYEYEWNWASALLEKHFEINLNTITTKEMISIVEQWKKSVVELDQLLYTDAKKEFSLSTQVGFGVDGNLEERAKDFASVRGEFGSNTTVMEILNHMQRKTALGDKVIAELEKINS